MPVSFELPHELEQSLRRSFADLDQAAKEAALVELYRQEKLTHFELSQALGFSRLQTEALLKQHGVVEDLPTPAEIRHDLETLRRLLER